MSGKKYPNTHKESYHKLSKTELFYVALSYFQYMNPDKPMDEAEFQKFVKSDVKNWVA